MAFSMLRRASANLFKEKIGKRPFQMAHISDHERNMIGRREIVGYGYNGQPIYVDRPDFPFSSIRWKEPSAEIDALREKEKGDWNELTLAEKKSLYRCELSKQFEVRCGLSNANKKVIQQTNEKLNVTENSMQSKHLIEDADSLKVVPQSKNPLQIGPMENIIDTKKELPTEKNLPPKKPEELVCEFHNHTTTTPNITKKDAQPKSIKIDEIFSSTARGQLQVLTNLKEKYFIQQKSTIRNDHEYTLNSQVKKEKNRNIKSVLKLTKIKLPHGLKTSNLIMNSKVVSPIPEPRTTTFQNTNQSPQNLPSSSQYSRQSVGPKILGDTHEQEIIFEKKNPKVVDNHNMNHMNAIVNAHMNAINGSSNSGEKYDDNFRACSDAIISSLKPVVSQNNKSKFVPLILKAKKTSFQNTNQSLQNLPSSSPYTRQSVVPKILGDTQEEVIIFEKKYPKAVDNYINKVNEIINSITNARMNAINGSSNSGEKCDNNFRAYGDAHISFLKQHLLANRNNKRKLVNLIPKAKISLQIANQCSQNLPSSSQYSRQSVVPIILGDAQEQELIFEKQNPKIPGSCNIGKLNSTKNTVLFSQQSPCQSMVQADVPINLDASLEKEESHHVICEITPGGLPIINNYQLISELPIILDVSSEAHVQEQEFNFGKKNPKKSSPGNIEKFNYATGTDLFTQDMQSPHQSTIQDVPRLLDVPLETPVEESDNVQITCENTQFGLPTISNVHSISELNETTDYELASITSNPTPASIKDKFMFQWEPDYQAKDSTSPQNILDINNRNKIKNLIKNKKYAMIYSGGKIISQRPVVSQNIRNTNGLVSILKRSKFNEPYKVLRGILGQNLKAATLKTTLPITSTTNLNCSKPLDGRNIVPDITIQNILATSSLSSNFSSRLNHSKPLDNPNNTPDKTIENYLPITITSDPGTSKCLDNPNNSPSHSNIVNEVSDRLDVFRESVIMQAKGPTISSLHLAHLTHLVDNIGFSEIDLKHSKLVDLVDDTHMNPINGSSNSGEKCDDSFRACSEATISSSEQHNIQNPEISKWPKIDENIINNKKSLTKAKFESKTNVSDVIHIPYVSKKGRRTSYILRPERRRRSNKTNEDRSSTFGIIQGEHYTAETEYELYCSNKEKNIQKKTENVKTLRNSDMIYKNYVPYVCETSSGSEKLSANSDHRFSSEITFEEVASEPSNKNSNITFDANVTHQKTALKITEWVGPIETQNDVALSKPKLSESKTGRSLKIEMLGKEPLNPSTTTDSLKAGITKEDNIKEIQNYVSTDMSYKNNVSYNSTNWDTLSSRPVQSSENTGEKASKKAIGGYEELFHESSKISPVATNTKIKCHSTVQTNKIGNTQINAVITFEEVPESFNKNSNITFDANVTHHKTSLNITELGPTETQKDLALSKPKLSESKTGNSSKTKEIQKNCNTDVSYNNDVSYISKNWDTLSSSPVQSSGNTGEKTSKKTTVGYEENFPEPSKRSSGATDTNIKCHSTFQTNKIGNTQIDVTQAKESLVDLFSESKTYSTCDMDIKLKSELAVRLIDIGHPLNEHTRSFERCALKRPQPVKVAAKGVEKIIITADSLNVFQSCTEDATARGSNNRDVRNKICDINSQTSFIKGEHNSVLERTQLLKPAVKHIRKKRINSDAMIILQSFTEDTSRENVKRETKRNKPCDIKSQASSINAEHDSETNSQTSFIKGEHNSVLERTQLLKPAVKHIRKKRINSDAMIILQSFTEDTSRKNVKRETKRNKPCDIKSQASSINAEHDSEITKRVKKSNVLQCCTKDASARESDKRDVKDKICDINAQTTFIKGEHSFLSERTQLLKPAAKERRKTVDAMIILQSCTEDTSPGGNVKRETKRNKPCDIKSEASSINAECDSEIMKRVKKSNVLQCCIKVASARESDKRDVKDKICDINSQTTFIKGEHNSLPERIQLLKPAAKDIRKRRKTVDAMIILQSCTEDTFPAENVKEDTKRNKPCDIKSQTSFINAEHNSETTKRVKKSNVLQSCSEDSSARENYKRDVRDKICDINSQTSFIKGEHNSLPERTQLLKPAAKDIRKRRKTVGAMIDNEDTSRENVKRGTKRKQCDIKSQGSFINEEHNSETTKGVKKSKDEKIQRELSVFPKNLNSPERCSDSTLVRDVSDDNISSDWDISKGTTVASSKLFVELKEEEMHRHTRKAVGTGSGRCSINLSKKSRANFIKNGDTYVCDSSTDEDEIAKNLAVKREDEEYNLNLKNSTSNPRFFSDSKELINDEGKNLPNSIKDNTIKDLLNATFNHRDNISQEENVSSDDDMRRLSTSSSENEVVENEKCFKPSVKKLASMVEQLRNRAKFC